MRVSQFGRLLAAVLGSSILFAVPANAAPTVTEITTGSAGAWIYTFSISNNLGGSNVIYFFGVRDPGATSGTLPAGWDLEGASWSNAGFGGSSIAYNLPWITFTNEISPGQMLGGFQVLDSSLAPTTSFDWFAYADGGTYLGSDNFNGTGNPGFEGVVTAPSTAAVPEPATWAMMLLGFGAIALAMRASGRRSLIPRSG